MCAWNIKKTLQVSDGIVPVGGEDMDWMIHIQKTVDFIEENICEELEVDMLADRIYTSRFYFQKVFTILCDCTVSEYIRNRRMTLAGSGFNQ